ncbi:cellulase family glycosylhydrolase [Nonomuraea sp. FMUSA5-5]|uniref:Cellulase family glycosylhydrolase n=1 Tax=Nonomuraea composti TaxID=2720023 RepID=A0ABX1BBR3_9ACTN|nr:cellulase family glycosylhydrolase [Nonomuraea sp. FMUSA5-5]
MEITTTDRRLHRAGLSFVALGVDHHPSAAGCRWWVDWDEDALRADFGRMAEAGLNSVRLFLFWRDFMPTEHAVDSEMLARLDIAVRAAGEAGLSCVLSLLTIWMNGQRLDLPWRRGRSVWRDPDLLAAEEAYARAVAKTAHAHGNVLAYDLGDELWNIDEAEALSLTKEEVAGWYRRLADALRAEAPGALVMQANDPSAVFGGGPYGCDNQRELDLIALHGFPPWAPGGIESTLSYKATNLPSFLAAVGSAYGPVLIDELGSYGVHTGTAASFLSAATASVLANGVAGVFVWCWQDIASAAEPYRERPAERYVGLHTLEGTPKPTMGAYRQVLDHATVLTAARAPASAALMLPHRLRGQGTSYLDGAGGAVAAFHSYLLLKRAHVDADVVTSAGLDHHRHDLVMCPAADRLTLDDLDALRAHAERGATVYLSLGDHLHGLPGADLVGAEIVDFRLGDDGKSALCWDDARWPLRWDPAVMKPTTMVATTGRVLASYPDGSPALVEQAVGRGRVLFTNAPLECQFGAPGLLTSSGWHLFYARIAEIAHVRPAVRCEEPDLEIVSGRDGGLVVVNHGEHPISAQLSTAGTRYAVSLGAKEWTVLGRRLPNHGRESAL